VDPDIDLPVVHRMLEAAMADHWDALSTSYEDFIDQNVRQDDFDPSLWWLAVDGDEAVGALIGSIKGDHGVVELVGVLRPHRRSRHRVHAPAGSVRRVRASRRGARSPQRRF
jgi:hypothetical protein